MTTHTARLLIDPGSELTFVSEQLNRQLNISRCHSTIPIIDIGGSQSTHTRGVTQLTLRSCQTSYSVQVQAHILRTVTSILPSFKIERPHWSHLENLMLADPEFLTPRAIDSIIGADCYGQVIRPNIIKGPPTTPIAQLSIFGWLILGPVHLDRLGETSSQNPTAPPDNTQLSKLLTKFWVQEELPSDTSDQLTQEEEECETHFRETHTRDSSGRYIVRIPLKLSASHLGTSYDKARRCLQQMLRRHTRDTHYKEQYHRFMEEYEELGHMVKADSIIPTGTPHYYLPHHGVLKPDSASTKLRVVFNGSSITTSEYSLNNLMHTGAKLQLNVPNVLI